MAQPLKAPSIHLLRHLRHQHSQWQRPIALYANRQFSSVPRRQAKRMARSPEEMGMSMPREKPQEAIGSQLRRQQQEMSRKAAKDVPKDFGIFPMTLIPPSTWNLREQLRDKSPLQIVKDLTILYWMRIKTRAQDLVATHYYYKRRIYPQPRKLRPKIRSRLIPAVAKDLHKQLFTAYAKGQKELISKFTAETLAQSMAARISYREKGERLQWNITRYLSRPKLVSQKPTELPFEIEGAKAGARQAVVRIHTEQRLQLGTNVQGRERLLSREREKMARDEFWQYEGDTVEWGSPKVKQLVEYVVLQRRLIKGVEEPWYIVGFAQESTIAELRRWRAGDYMPKADAVAA